MNKKTIMALGVLSAGVLWASPLIHSDCANDRKAPLVWDRPKEFDPGKPHLGLPVLTGATHRVLYDPLPSEADKTGRHESLRHGTYNHHQSFVRYKDRVIVLWTNHMRDENGPGMRFLAKTGRLAADESDIDWGKDETLSEIGPSAHPVRRRRNKDDTSVIDGIFVNSGLEVLEDGRLFVSTSLKVCDGWADDIQYHVGQGLREPIPDEHYEAYKTVGPDRKRGFRWDIYWYVGRYLQQVEMDDAGRIKPAGQMYVVGKPPKTEMRLTPTITKKLLPLNEPYRSAVPYGKAPEELRSAYSTGRRVASCGRTPRYAPGTFKLAENGKNGLFHNTEFVRPDGMWVAVRDNLLDTEIYYAAVKGDKDGFYPPGRRTNMFGGVMPVAGELPSGAVWLIGSNLNRTEAFITLAKDGIHFNKTWSLLSLNLKATLGICKGSGGAQYFRQITIGPNIWVVYSIAKEQVGITKIPVALLEQKLKE